MSNILETSFQNLNTLTEYNRSANAKIYLGIDKHLHVQFQPKTWNLLIRLHNFFERFLHEEKNRWVQQLELMKMETGMERLKKNVIFSANEIFLAQKTIKTLFIDSFRATPAKATVKWVRNAMDKFSQLSDEISVKSQLLLIICQVKTAVAGSPRDCKHAAEHICSFDLALREYINHSIEERQRAENTMQIWKNSLEAAIYELNGNTEGKEALQRAFSRHRILSVPDHFNEKQEPS